MRCLRSDMDEVESMWMEMVVFRIDLMSCWMYRHCSDKCEVDGIFLLAHDVLIDGWTRCGSPDTRTKGGRWIWAAFNESGQMGSTHNWSQPHTIFIVRHGWWNDEKLDRTGVLRRTMEYDEEKTFAWISEPCRIISAPTTGIRGITLRWCPWKEVDIMESSE